MQGVHSRQRPVSDDDFGTPWLGPVSWAGVPGLGYAGSFLGAPPQELLGFPFAGISRCLLPCSVLRLGCCRLALFLREIE